ncbi:enolase C-terminal domain-like protein [Lentzea sp. NEAU-D7]|uniref:enolase C-terminal domain-like protein n=1 Tax=Lentzea sp. NEAU-D7 TaxID=2994667 RepID=UPI00224B49FB|nr:enolase C-terminal domain-like protein [Lentzea sp. NEAU-D7]MCX2948857.1 mandelate racemase [Lentzea sp. NEAU-D7]
MSADVYQIELDEPHADGTLTWRHITVVISTVRADGVTGVGWTYGAGGAADVIRDVLAPAIDGMDTMDVQGCWQAMRVGARNALVPGLVMSAISAVDIALWDLKAKTLGTPLSWLLGRVRTAVPVYGSGGFTSLGEDELGRQLGTWVHEDGMSSVKMKIGGTTDERDVRRMNLARQAIGSGAQLFVDANGAYTAKQAVRIADRAAEADVTWLEEPVSSNDLTGLAMVRNAVQADVAAGEYGTSEGYFREMCQAGAVDCLQVDVTRCGGITGFLRAAAIAGSFELEISSHTAPQLHAAVSCAVPNIRHIEWFSDHVRADEILFAGCVRPDDGFLTPQTELSGHGLAVRDATDHRVQFPTWSATSRSL